MTERRDLHVEEAGNAAGPPVLLLHGFMSSNHQWEPNRDGLGAELHLLLTEQPGHGSSPGPDDLDAYRADTVIDQLDRIRSDRGLDRLWLVGQSLGGAILIRYALRHPDRVGGLVFTNSRAVFGLAGRRPSDTGGKRPVESFTREHLRSMPYHPINAKRIPKDQKARMVAAADAMTPGVFRHLRNSGPWDSSADLDQLRVPTLLINGRYEKAFQPCVEQAKTALPDLRVAELDGGHSVNIDQPQAFNRAVLDFVRHTDR